MFTIRNEQMKILADDCFAVQLERYLKRNYPESVVMFSDRKLTVAEIPIHTLKELILTGMSRARGYGLIQEINLAAFIVFMFIYSPNFDDHPLIKRILTDERLAPDARIEKLCLQISADNFEAARLNYDQTAWQ